MLGLPNGVPSADTLRRVIGGLDHVAFRTVVIPWARDLCQATAGKWACSRFDYLVEILRSGLQGA